MNIVFIHKNCILSHQEPFPAEPKTLTCAHCREEEQPEETEDRCSHHLGDSPYVNLLIQFGGQVGIVHVVSIYQVFEQHVHQSWENRRTQFSSITVIIDKQLAQD